jgi:hypothetical protein
MQKKLPHLHGLRQWVYTANTMHYSWQTIVTATTMQKARALGHREARAVMGNHARIHTDTVVPFPPDL